MNIDVNSKVGTKTIASSTTNNKKNSSECISEFAKELTQIEEGVGVNEKEKSNDSPSNVKEKVNEEADKEPIESEENSEIDDVIGGLEGVVAEMSDKLNHSDDKNDIGLKEDGLFDDKFNKEDNSLINNDMNIQEPNEALIMQMGANMNFNSNGQPFSEFLNEQNGSQKLSVSQKDLAEEQAILSTMEENIAIANKNMLQAHRVKTVANADGVKKVDKDTNITIETVVKFDTVIMTKSDVDFFMKLVENGQMDINSQEALKSSQVSKTLADLISKAMKDNQPIRIDFDNNISVIIKIGRDGKISADFLPSSQIAEAYLKENLPLLRQKFEDNNIEYDELNHRQQKQDEKNNRKKERKDE